MALKVLFAIVLFCGAAQARHAIQMRQDADKIVPLATSDKKTANADKIVPLATSDKKPAKPMSGPPTSTNLQPVKMQTVQVIQPVKMQSVQLSAPSPDKIPTAPDLPTMEPGTDMCAAKINEEMKVIEETLTRCAEEGNSGPAFDYCVLGICGTQFTAGYTVCQQARFWRMARDCDTRVCLVDLRKFWLTTPTPNGFQLPTGNGEGMWKWIPYGEE